MKFPYELIDDPKLLAQFGEWDEQLYCDFLRCQSGEMSEEQFREKYSIKVAILILNMTGFTKTALKHGSLYSCLRIFDIQKICAPVFLKYGAKKIRTFADDFTATFYDPESALDAALEIHRRVRIFNQSEQSSNVCFECTIGLGYGEVFEIGPDKAMGNEMNQTSKLGEDVAEGGETLITEGFYQAVKGRSDVNFVPSTNEELPFRFYQAETLEKTIFFDRRFIPKTSLAAQPLGMTQGA
jgi:class 3 adenylate cyclase